jgi:hypothetical protein
VFSPCRQYRYRLWRKWSDKPYLCVLLLNPSTADELVNDPTVERCERRARQMGFGGLEVVNIFAFRATDPKKMKAQLDPEGPENDRYIAEVVRGAGMVLCGWGQHGKHRRRWKRIMEILMEENIIPYCLEIGKDGQPKHPLYIGYAVKPRLYCAS